MRNHAESQTIVNPEHRSRENGGPPRIGGPVTLAHF